MEALEQYTWTVILVKKRIQTNGNKCGSYCKHRRSYKDGCGALQFRCDVFDQILHRQIEEDSDLSEHIAVYRCPECKQHVEQQVK